MAGVLAGVLGTVLEIFFWLILIRALMSWFRPRSYSKLYEDIYSVLYTATEPVLSPLRGLVPPERLGLDVSPFIAMIIIDLIKRAILWRFL